jgi:hypothetical protein
VLDDVVHCGGVVASWFEGSPEGRVAERVANSLEPGETLWGAVVANQGRAPSRHYGGDLIGLTMEALRVKTRARSYVIAVTDRAIVVFKATKSNRPVRVVARYPGHDRWGGLHRNGDYWVDVAGEQYWLEEHWAPIAHRLAKQIRPRG